MEIILLSIAVTMIALALLFKKDTQRKLPLQLAEKIYAVPGLECSIYFNNIVTAVNYRNYAYEVICDIGRTDSARWRVIPEEKDIGEHQLTIRVYDDNGMIAEAAAVICVAAPVTEKKELSLLLMGDSQTAAAGYPERIYDLMKKESAIDFSMVGTNAGDYAEPLPGGVAHEGYGGWGWHTFFKQYGIVESVSNDGLHPVRPWVRNSRFLFPDGDGFKFDLKAYCEKYNQGKVPDTLIVMLGTNNIFCAKCNEEIDRIWRTDIYPFMKQLAAEFRKLDPAIHIAFCSLTPGAFSQDAFGNSYQCDYTLWQWRKNLSYYHEKLFAAVKELGVGLIPVHTAVDGDNGFPETEEAANAHSEKAVVRQSNAVHPDRAGYGQIGDCIFSYLINMLGSR